MAGQVCQLLLVLCPCLQGSPCSCAAEGGEELAAVCGPAGPSCCSTHSGSICQDRVLKRAGSLPLIRAAGLHVWAAWLRAPRKSRAQLFRQMPESEGL